MLIQNVAAFHDGIHVVSMCSGSELQECLNPASSAYLVFHGRPNQPRRL